MNSTAAVDFATEQELCFPSSWFRKSWRKTSTWFHASSRKWFQQDHFMVRQRDRFLVTDVTSRNDSEIGSDHKPVVMHIRVRKPHRQKTATPLQKFDAQAVANRPTDQCDTFEQLIRDIVITADLDADAAYEAFVSGCIEAADQAFTATATTPEDVAKVHAEYLYSKFSLGDFDSTGVDAAPGESVADNI